jgi:hypothetical protein
MDKRISSKISIPAEKKGNYKLGCSKEKEHQVTPDRCMRRNCILLNDGGESLHDKVSQCARGVY